MGVYFLHPGRFSLLDMALQSLPPLLRIWTRMEHGEALWWLPTYVLSFLVCEHQVGGPSTAAADSDLTLRFLAARLASGHSPSSLSWFPNRSR